jgi:SAM-dependent methyltransferase
MSQTGGLSNCFDTLFRYDDIIGGDFMDDYAVSDFLAYDPARKFDLVTLTGGMEYFDADRFFAKLSSILEPGGVFATFNDYFYELHGGAMHLPMGAPWLHARLSKPDLLRYYGEHHADISATAEQALYFPSTHCTVRNFISIATSHGLEMMAYRRSIGTPALNNFFFTDPFLRDYFFGCVLPDCRAFNETVTADDLFTYYLTLVFRKPA